MFLYNTMTGGREIVERIFSTGDEEEGVYEGEARGGVRAGVGVMSYRSGKVYRGEWLFDKWNGLGEIVFPLAEEVELHRFMGEGVEEESKHEWSSSMIETPQEEPTAETSQ